jgi:very-short-patch-repair endonuclease
MVKVLGQSAETPISGTRDERIFAIAGAQRGLVARCQLLAAGISSNAIDRLVGGRLRRVHRGVFAVGHDAPIPLAAETAALLAVRDGAALSHHTAAELWGLRPPGSGDGRIHVTVVGGSLRDRRGIAVHTSERLGARDVRFHEQLPVTSAARALLDIAPTIPTRELERALDQALIRRVADLREVGELLGRWPRRPGRHALQSLVEDFTATTFTRSEAEELFLDLIRQAELPRPLTNVRRHGYEIDFLWPDQGLAVEIDGFRYHNSRRSFESDRRRDARLNAARITVIRITWRQLRYEPIAVMVSLAQSLTRAPR